MKMHYDWKMWQEIGWAILIAVAAYLAMNIGNVKSDEWGDWNKVWVSLGVGAVRAALGALVASAGHLRRHPGTDLPPGGSELPERFAHKDHTDFRDL
jgi:hypothetical protein